LLDRAEQIASERRQSLSAVISDLVENALETRDSLAERNADVLESWRKAFAGLTEEEMMLADGIVLDDRSGDRTHFL
jgi:hypothetical protein